MCFHALFLAFMVTVSLLFFVLNAEYQFLHFYLFSIPELPSAVLICLGVGHSGLIFVFV